MTASEKSFVAMTFFNRYIVAFFEASVYFTLLSLKEVRILCAISTTTVQC